MAGDNISHTRREPDVHREGDVYAVIFLGHQLGQSFDAIDATD